MRALAEGIVTRTSPHPASETLARLLALISKRSLTLFAVVDHSGAAAQAGTHLRETKLVIFGSPLGGTPAMELVPTLALELPLKVLIWEDDDAVRISYTSPSYLAARHGLPPELAAPFAGVEAIVEAVVA
ncbi:MAG: DUF302 domain-containing protein [Gaiellales bacterium]